MIDILFFLVARPKNLRCPSKNETSIQTWDIHSSV